MRTTTPPFFAVGFPNLTMTFSVVLVLKRSSQQVALNVVHKTGHKQTPEDGEGG